MLLNFEGAKQSFFEPASCFIHNPSYNVLNTIVYNFNIDYDHMLTSRYT